MMTPPMGSTHHCGKALMMKIMGAPSSSPKKKPKFWMKRSSFLPTSRNIRLARVRVGLELLVDSGGAADLGDGGVDRHATHFGGAGRDDPLPADAAVHHSRDLLDLPWR